MMVFAIAGIFSMLITISMVILGLLFDAGAIPETWKQERWFPQKNQRQRLVL